MMVYYSLIAAIAIIFSAWKVGNDGNVIFPLQNVPVQEEDYPYVDPDTLIIQAENKATEDGRKILEKGREMTLINAEILPGGCWDYINTVYNRAGYPSNKRKNIFKSVKNGPYADVNLIQHGDWLYYVNHSYGDIEHSAIFVDWINKENKEALMLSYGGEKRQNPARYLSYDLSSVYQIIRGVSK